MLTHRYHPGNVKWHTNVARTDTPQSEYILQSGLATSDALNQSPCAGWLPAAPMAKCACTGRVCRYGQELRARARRIGGRRYNRATAAGAGAGVLLALALALVLAVAAVMATQSAAALRTAGLARAPRGDRGGHFTHSSRSAARRSSRLMDASDALLTQGAAGGPPAEPAPRINRRQREASGARGARASAAAAAHEAAATRVRASAGRRRSAAAGCSRPCARRRADVPCTVKERPWRRRPCRGLCAAPESPAAAPGGAEVQRG
jgi:hypothetical protein